MSTILDHVITHEAFAPKVEAALYTALRQKSLTVEDARADQETVEIEHFKVTSAFRFDEAAAKAGEEYIQFSVSGEASVRYRDINTGQEENTRDLFLTCDGYAQLTTPYYDPKTDQIEDAVERITVEVPLKDLVIKTK